MRPPTDTLRSRPSRARALPSSILLTGLLFGLGAPLPAGAKEAEPEATEPTPPVEKQAEPFDVTPKQTDLYVGYAQRVRSSLPDVLPAPAGDPATTEVEGARSRGLEVVWEYTWQVGGFLHRWPSWVGFFLGFVHFPGGDERRQSSVLEYGLRIKHTLFPGETVRPFFSYGLGAVQVFVAGVDGRGIGHLTRGGLGVDLPLNDRLAFSLELSYRFQSLPGFAGGPGRDFHTASILTGLTYDLASKP